MSGAEVEWQPPMVHLAGAVPQVAKAEKLLLRIIKHCLWGASPQKVDALLSSEPWSSARLRLTPMGDYGGALRAYDIHLTPKKRSVTIGKAPESDIVVSDTTVSRTHSIVEMD